MKKEKKEMSKQQTGKSTGSAEDKEPQSRRGSGGGAKKGNELASFQDILDSYIDGLTVQQLAEKHDLAVDTVKAKIPKLQVDAKRMEDKVRAKLEREGVILPTNPGGPR